MAADFVEAARAEFPNVVEQVKAGAERIAVDLLLYGTACLTRFDTGELKRVNPQHVRIMGG